MPELPCPVITAMRNRPVHAYFGIDHDFIWSAATSGMSALLPLLVATPCQD